MPHFRTWNKISYAVPETVENEKGLLVDFSIIGAAAKSTGGDHDLGSPNQAAGFSGTAILGFGDWVFDLGQGVHATEQAAASSWGTPFDLDIAADDEARPRPEEVAPVIQTDDTPPGAATPDAPTQPDTADVFVFKADLASPEIDTAAEHQGIALIISEDASPSDPDDMALHHGMMVDAGAHSAEGNLLIISEDLAIL